MIWNKSLHLKYLMTRLLLIWELHLIWCNHLTYPLNLYSTGFLFKCFSFKPFFMNLAWVIHPQYAYHWPNLTVISSQTNWSDRVMLHQKRRETVSSPAQRSLHKRQNNLLEQHRLPISSLLEVQHQRWEREKVLVPIHLPSQACTVSTIPAWKCRAGETRCLSLPGTTGIHSLLYKHEGSLR